MTQAQPKQLIALTWPGHADISASHPARQGLLQLTDAGHIHANRTLRAGLNKTVGLVGLFRKQHAAAHLGLGKAVLEGFDIGVKNLWAHQMQRRAEAIDQLGQRARVPLKQALDPQVAQAGQ